MKVRQILEYAAMRAAMGVASRLPEQIAYPIAGGLGGLYLRFSKRRQEIALRTLRNAFPDRSDAELLRHAKRGTGNLLKVALDVARAGRFIKSGRFLERMDLSGFEWAKRPGPWIGVTGHLGSWEAASVAMALSGYQVHVVARLMKNPRAQAWLARSRRACGIHLHDRRGGIRAVTTALQHGAVALQAIDQNQRLRGVFAPFFGELASCERAAATLAVRKGYPILVGSCTRVGQGFRFKFEIEDVVEPEQSGDIDADVLATITRMNQVMETLIRRYPDQYLWIHDRYRTRPPEEKAAAAARAAATAEVSVIDRT